MSSRLASEKTTGWLLADCVTRAPRKWPCGLRLAHPFQTDQLQDRCHLTHVKWVVACQRIQWRKKAACKRDTGPPASLPHSGLSR